MERRHLAGVPKKIGSLVIPGIRSAKAQLWHPATRPASWTYGLWLKLSGRVASDSLPKLSFGTPFSSRELPKNQKISCKHQKNLDKIFYQDSV
ncbi:MAG: hypothetical protein GY801_46640 [bacterium]|nr:hypothetical protein [bacterium]